MSSFALLRLSLAKLAPRDLTSKISWSLDNLLPPVLRDRKWFMLPLMKIAYGKSLARKVMNFRSQSWKMTDQEYGAIYNEYNNSRLGKRVTDLNQETIELLPSLIVGRSVLDAGCGQGFLLAQLQRRRPELALHGVDVALAKSEYLNSAAKFSESKLESLPFGNGEFDTVISTHTLEHVQDIEESLRQLRRVSRKRLVVVLPRQRHFLYSFDLHLRFFPYMHCLYEFFDPSVASITLVDGDWLIVEDFDL